MPTRSAAPSRVRARVRLIRRCDPASTRPRTATRPHRPPQANAGRASTAHRVAAREQPASTSNHSWNGRRKPPAAPSPRSLSQQRRHQRRFAQPSCRCNGGHMLLRRPQASACEVETDLSSGLGHLRVRHIFRMPTMELPSVAHVLPSRNPVSSRTTTVRKNCRAATPGPSLCHLPLRPGLPTPAPIPRKPSVAVHPSALARGVEAIVAPHPPFAVRTVAPRTSASASAPWSKWRGPAREKRSASHVGSGPFTPRKALANARAALRFARRAKGACGAPTDATKDSDACESGRPDDQRQQRWHSCRSLKSSMPWVAIRCRASVTTSWQAARTRSSC